MRPTLPAARGSSQLAAIAESLVTDAERSNRRVTCLLHIISDGTRVRHAQGIILSILRVFIACAATVQTSLHLAETLRPTALPHDSALPLDHVQVAAVRAAWHQLGRRHSVLCFAGRSCNVRVCGFTIITAVLLFGLVLCTV